MYKANPNDDTAELLTPDEFMKRLGIRKSALHQWKAKGWLVPGRHFIKIGNVVRYWWSEDRLREIHENANNENEQHKYREPKIGGRSPYGERVNWDL